MTDQLLNLAIGQIERGHIPDFAIRWGIRRLCAQRLEECAANGNAASFARRMRDSEIAPLPQRANEQHYEVPPEFFEHVLGVHRKYSSCFWPGGCESLDQAEAASLELTCRHADLEDGNRILELGCGWGSLSLWMAERLSNSEIVAVSNSAPQRLYIEQEASRRGLRNLRVITADMNSFEPPGRFHRVVSVEMFEHMRNYAELLRRVSGWMEHGGRLLVHVFCHRKYAYAFENHGAHNWMGRYFFTAGIMPSADLFAHFQDDVRLIQQWQWGGGHYQKTAEAWLRNLDQNKDRILPILARTYPKEEAPVWFERWRVFFLACAELFGYEGGSQWQVGHYLFEPR